MTDHDGSSYKGYIGISHKSGRIGHYSKNQTHSGQWELQIERVENRGGTHHFVVSLKKSTQKGTRWLSANGSGGMGSETQNSSDEKFVIMGSMKKCRVQRYDNFKAGNDDGYLRAHHLAYHRDQADITADGNTNANAPVYWIPNPGGTGQTWWDFASQQWIPFERPLDERETTFYLGLFH